MFCFYVQVKKNVRLTCVVDACHNGSIVDLPYIISEDTVDELNGDKPEDFRNKKWADKDFHPGLLWCPEVLICMLWS